MFVLGLTIAADHPVGHGLRVRAQLGVHAGHDHIEFAEQRVLLIKSAVLEDVDLDPAQATERRHQLVQIVDHGDLFPQPLGGESAGHRESR